jgi:hypothetical protein
MAIWNEWKRQDELRQALHVISNLARHSERVMKSKSSAKRFPVTKAEWKREIAKAPRRVNDPDSPYDPDDGEAVRKFWAKGTVRYPGQSGPQRTPTQ